MSSKITRLTKYVSVFGNVDWLERDEAVAKLARERELYSKWKDLDLVTRLQEPRIEEAGGER